MNDHLKQSVIVWNELNRENEGLIGKKKHVKYICHTSNAPLEDNVEHTRVNNAENKEDVT